MPRDPRQPYDMRRAAELIVDRGSLFEIAPRHGRSLITALARLDGRPVGVLASDPKHYGGGLTAEASDKMARFVDLCDAFRLPVAHLVDQPGFVIGTESEKRGTIRRGSRALSAVMQARVPWCYDPRAQGLRRRRCRSRRRLAAEPALRLALGPVGLAADRGRPGGRLPPRARGRRGPRRAARADRGAPQPRALAVPHGGALLRRGDRRPRESRPLLCDWAARAHELVALDAPSGPVARGTRP